MSFVGVVFVNIFHQCNTHLTRAFTVDSMARFVTVLTFPMMVHLSAIILDDAQMPEGAL